jgi:hypothetical protein
MLKKTRLYIQIQALQRQLARAPQDIRSKGDIRRYRKLKPYIKYFRRKTLILTLIYSAVFLVIYTGGLLITWFISNIIGKFYVISPIGIPFLSGFSRDLGYFIIPTHVVVLVAFIGVFYLITREVKL